MTRARLSRWLKTRSSVWRHGARERRAVHGADSGLRDPQPEGELKVESGAEFPRRGGGKAVPTRPCAACRGDAAAAAGPTRAPEARLPFERRRSSRDVRGAIGAAHQGPRSRPRRSCPPAHFARSPAAPPYAVGRCCLPRRRAFRSAATITGRPVRRSTSAAARTSSARCSSARQSEARWPLEHPSACEALPAQRRSSAQSASRRSCSAGWFAIRITGSHVRSRSPATSWHRLATEDPSPEQLEVAEAALAACLKLEHGAAGRH
jgi:hypothetical protein